MGERTTVVVGEGPLSFAAVAAVARDGAAVALAAEAVARLERSRAQVEAAAAGD